MSVSLCAFQLELAPDSPIPKRFRYLAPKYQSAMASKPESSDSKDNPSRKEGSKEKSWANARGKRELQEIVIETYENEDPVSANSGAKNKKSLMKMSRASPKGSSFDAEVPSTSKESSPALATIPSDGEVGAKNTDIVTNSVPPENFLERKKFKDQISFSSGNPFVEVVKGILHFYKENQMTSLEEDVPRSQLICMLAIPAWLTCHDLLHFLAPCCPGIRRVRIIRDATPNQYMALVLFRTQEEADEFYKNFNGTPYNSMESELCHLVYVAQVEICGDGIDSGGMDVPMTGHTELPTCTVCLERMDESVDGILTILCNHSFHGSCLAKWGDTTCPVCRYLQSPEVSADSFCSECKSVESLWICLICGHVGCGRYVGGHAHNHFLETQHCYAMQLGNSRVWDYVGDNFVHRLLQNKADGKLVEVEGNNNGRQFAPNKVDSMEHEDKLDSVQLEYTYLLTRQLESQRIYFEEMVDRIEQQFRKEKEETKERVQTALEKFDHLERELSAVKKEKEAVEKKLTTRLTKALTELSKAIAELQEEKALNCSLVANQSTWQQRVSQLEQQLEQVRGDRDRTVTQLEEQLRDIYLHLEARDKMKDSELEGGQVVVAPSPTSPSPTRPGTGSKGARSKRKGK